MKEEQRLRSAAIRRRLTEASAILASEHYPVAAKAAAETDLQEAAAEAAALLKEIEEAK